MIRINDSGRLYCVECENQKMTSTERTLEYLRSEIKNKLQRAIDNFDRARLLYPDLYIYCNPYSEKCVKKHECKCVDDSNINLNLTRDEFYQMHNTVQYYKNHVDCSSGKINESLLKKIKNQIEKLYK